MNKRLLSFLTQLARTRGQSYYQPLSGNDNDLANFQREVDELKSLQADGVLEIIGKPHRESISGHQFVDLIKIELTPNGVTWVSKYQSQNETTDNKHLSRLLKIVRAANASEDSLIDLLRF